MWGLVEEVTGPLLSYMAPIKMSKMEASQYNVSTQGCPWSISSWSSFLFLFFTRSWRCTVHCCLNSSSNELHAPHNFKTWPMWIWYPDLNNNNNGILLQGIPVFHQWVTKSSDPFLGNTFLKSRTLTHRTNFQFIFW